MTKACEKMRILLVSTGGFPDPRYYRSNELALCTALVKLGHNVTLFSSDKQPKWQMLDDRQIRLKEEVINGFTIKRFLTGIELGNVPLMPSLFWHILRFDCDIIHAHEMVSPSSFYCALASRANRVPIIVTQHDYLFGNTHGAKLFLYILNDATIGRFTLRTSNATIGLSSASVKLVQRFGATTQKTRLIPTSVDTTAFRPNQKSVLKTELGVDGPVILFIGRLMKRKGADVLLRAFKPIVDKIPSANLVIVGKGPEETKLRELQMSLHLNNVFFLGRIPRELMPEVYAGADLFVLPSLYYEIFGNVLVEAMASGLPVISTNVGGMTDIVTHGKTGFRIAPGDVDQLSKCMLSLITNDELRSKMSKAARRDAVERFDDMAVARIVEAMYRKSLT